MKIWNDPAFENFSAHGKYVFIYLLTNPFRNESALYSLSLKRLSSDTGLSTKETTAALKELITAEKIQYDWEVGVVWVKNAVRHQALNANCMKSILNDLQHCSSVMLVKYFVDYYTKINGYQWVTNGLANPPIGTGTGTGDREEEGGVGEETRPDLEQYLLSQWGRQGTTSYEDKKQFVELCQAYGWRPVYNSIDVARQAGKDQQTLRYVKGILRKEKENTQRQRSIANGSSPSPGILARSLMHCYGCEREVRGDLLEEHERTCEAFKKLKPYKPIAEVMEKIKGKK